MLRSKNEPLGWALVACALLIVAVSAGCTQSSQDEPTVWGTWRLTYDYNCDGSTATAIWYLSSDGYMEDNVGGTGYWTQSGRTVVVTYDVGAGTRFVGTVTAGGTEMSGEMRDFTGNVGCWQAGLISRSLSFKAPPELSNALDKPWR